MIRALSLNEQVDALKKAYDILVPALALVQEESGITDEDRDFIVAGLDQSIGTLSVLSAQQPVPREPQPKPAAGMFGSMF